MGAAQRIVFYDGECGLCQRSVQWLLNHDTDGKLSFAPLQGTTAEEKLASCAALPEGLDSIVYFESEADEVGVYIRSRAIFQLAKHLDPRWRGLRHLRWIPSFLSDLAYRAVAKVRYRVWGKADLCRVPTALERARFLP